ncbi:MAG TPA: IS200/IS605 family transposase [Candidatus Magasanikbacteria bacterium]|nr:IS200/IS605 family transposase [Candidatus Magasanikbacteria bacterium]
MTLKRSYHCVYDTHYHMVFPVKYRKILLSEPIVQKIKEIAKEIEERFELTIETIGCDSDHIHLLCGFHPKYAGGDIVRMFKSITAREMFRQFPDLKKELWGGEFWSDGYYISTIGERGNLNTIKQYIINQGKKPEEAQLRLI